MRVAFKFYVRHFARELGPEFTNSFRGAIDNENAPRPVSRYLPPEQLQRYGSSRSSSPKKKHVPPSAPEITLSNQSLQGHSSRDGILRIAFHSPISFRNT